MIELAPNATKATRRKEICKRNYSFHATLQEPEAQEELRLKLLLRNAQLQEDFLQNLLTLEDHLAEVEQLIEICRRELEEYLNE